MAALLAIITFAFFVTLEIVLSRRRAAAEAKAGLEPAPARSPGFSMPKVVEPVWVAGFEVPEDVHYHQGHTWARAVGPDTVAVGMDDFATRLTGPAHRLEVPDAGSWVQQGGDAFRVDSNGRSAHLVSPVDGEVVEVNPELRKDPTLSTKDPYRRGWICTVRVPGLAANLRNLLSGRMARRWIEETRDQLELRLMALSGSVLQDGGEPARDFARHLDTEDWKVLIESFLLTKAEDK
jgi:glycine cleavage system H lipoate-binding protein